MALDELLRFEAATKTFTDRQYRTLMALENISLSVSHGEFVSILGPSGCGKTTLLRMAAGLEMPSSGRILYEGRPFAGPAKERGLVFQSYSAFPWLTVRENICFGLKQGSENADMLSKWLAVTGLSEFAEAYPKTLSGGMRQRMAIARAMIVEPKLLLLDEPFGALDDRTRDSMRTMLLSAADSTGCSIMLVTHDIREAILMSDRIAVLSARPGKVVEIMTSTLPKPRTRRMITSPDFEAMYQKLAPEWQADTGLKDANSEKSQETPLIAQ